MEPKQWTKVESWTINHSNRFDFYTMMPPCGHLGFYFSLKHEAIHLIIMSVLNGYPGTKSFENNSHFLSILFHLFFKCEDDVAASKF